MDHRVIPTPTEINPSLNSADGTLRAALNRDIKFNEVHDLFLDRTISPSRTTDESLGSAFRQTAWSPVGLLPDGRPILAAATADHRVTTYRNGRWNWEKMDEVSARLLDHVEEADWAGFIEPDQSQVFGAHKARSYLLGTIALDWSPLYEGPNGLTFAFLATLQRSGHLVLWKVLGRPEVRLQFSGLYDLQMADPSSVRLAQGGSDSFLLLAGSHKGTLKAWSFTWTDGEPTCSPLGAIIPDEDQISIGAIRVDHPPIGNPDVRVVCAAKNSALVAVSLQLDGNGMKILDTGFARLPGLQISGWTRLSGGNLVCATEDFQVFEVDLSVNDKGTFFNGLEVSRTALPSNPAMLCRGLSGPLDGKTLFALETVKVAYDHLKCREPTSLVVYLKGDVQQTMKDLKEADKMGQSLIDLETYKALYGSNWESIWEMESEDPTSESDHDLQLLRWLALYKSYVCLSERRHDKDLQDDLKSHAERAEVILQARHIQRTLSDLLQLKDVQPVDLLNVRLACDLARISTQPSIIDSSLVKSVKDRFLKAETRAILELCPVCEGVIPFERRDEGQCPNGHRSLRCRATLRTCFERTRSCRWCGSHYHPSTGIKECILCGGPTC